MSRLRAKGGGAPFVNALENKKSPDITLRLNSYNIISSDGNDVELTAYQYGKEKKYIVNGTNILGLSIAFQNR
jgi:hypothetical protein